MRVFLTTGNAMRKLAIAAFSFSLSIFAANYIFTRTGALYAALVCALIGAALLSLRLKSLRGALIAAFAAVFGLLVFSVHYDLTVERAHVLSGETKELDFVLLENPEIYDHYTRAGARIVTAGEARLNCLLYDSDGRLEDFAAGDRIAAKVRLSAADLRYGVKTNRYTAKDIYLTATLKDDPRDLGHSLSIRSAAAALSKRIADRIDRVFPGDTAAFFKALSLGDKKDLYRDDALYVALSRGGLMHIVAVSGMHVGYLVGFLQVFVGKGRKGALICLPLVWGFVAVSGFSPSAMRAAFMQTMLLLAPIVGRENDPLTSLSAALAFLLFLNPFSASNISLQLSFAAMLGIVTVGEALESFCYDLLGERASSRFVRHLVGIVCCSLGVMIFTLPISAAYFGYVTLLSPISNLLCLWAVPICFLGAFLACLLSWVLFPLGKLAALLLSFLARYIIWIGETVSSWDFAVVYLTHRIMWLWIVLFYVSLLLAAAFKLKMRWRISIPLLTALSALLLSRAALIGCYSAADGTLAAIDVGQGQCIAAFSGDATIVLDCGSVSYGEYNAGDEAAAYLKSCGRKKIDALVFTHLHEDHANGLERLANLMEVKKIVLPESAADDEDAFREIVGCALRHGIRIEGVTENRLENVGGIGLLLLASCSEGTGNESCMPTVIMIDGYKLLVTGDAPAAAEEKLVRECDLAQIDALIVGHHGSKNASCEAYLEAIGGRRAIISVGKNSFGHPASETLERLKAFGYTVSRTDTDGTVEIRIDG